MSAFPSQENRPLKKPRLGPPDVYPQDTKQKEDELTATSVKHGFNNSPPIGWDEYGSARRENISQEKFGKDFISVLNKKTEINTLQDTTKKKQMPTKDIFWPAAKNQGAMRAWFKDLAGNKPLSSLGRKVPTFNKKEEVFSTLCEFAVPMTKAAWFIKMFAAYNVAVQEKMKQRRHLVDQSMEWCQAITKYMRDQVQKIQEPHSGPGSTAGFLTVSQPDPNQALKQWHYTCKLARHMYDEGLLDRHEFLSWLIDLIEKMKQNEDTVFKLLMAQILLYMEEITRSVILSRRLAHFSSKKIAQLCNEADCMPPRTESPMLTNGSTGMTSSQIITQNPLSTVFAQYNNCPQHRGIVLSLCATLQIITLLCPSSLVWNSLGDEKSSSFLCGSPLDLLPCAPSSLPMPQGPQNMQIRAQIRMAENQVRQRGRAVELRWSSDKCQQSTKGNTITRVLEVLDTLDRHNFDKEDISNSLDTLYHKIFTATQTKDSTEEDELLPKPFISDEPIIHLLIDWSVSTRRSGIYRAVVVAKLLEKRQFELKNEDFDSSMECDGGLGDDVLVSYETPLFQGVLMSYLDDKAPVIDDNPNDIDRQAFANLIQLFSELIRHDVFSHDAYMCFLISRGDLMSSPLVMSATTDCIDLSSIKSQSESVKHETHDDFKVDIMDMRDMSDIGSLFGTGKDEQRTSPEEPASVKSVMSEKETHHPMSNMLNMEQQPKGPSRHMLYAQHFPIPYEDSVHECNQRTVVLYGVGKARDDAKHVVKKISKEVLKMFSKKNCVDIISGELGRVKKRKEKDASDSLSNVSMNFESVFEGIFNKFQKLSFHDQHFVTAQCRNLVLDEIKNFTTCNSFYLPLVENVSYLFDLMEYSLNIYGLLDFSVQLLKELSNVEEALTDQKSSLVGNYTTSLCLCIVGVFRKYHAYLLVSPELTVVAFEGLISVVRKICNPSDCSSSERCILAYLYDAYTSCNYLKDKFCDMFSNPYRKMKMTLYATITPSASNKLWDPCFMVDFMQQTNIKIPLDDGVINDLRENPAHRYSFVCNAMLHICNTQDTDRLNEISILCAELTARCNALSSEWLGVLQALCFSCANSCGFIDILTQIDVSDMSIHDSLAVFTAILIARHCFSLQDLVVHVVLPSLLSARPTASGDQDAENGARLTCHILLRLFKTSDMTLTSPGLRPGTKGQCNIKRSCDKHLLAAAHDSITVGPVLAVLKAMLVLSDLCSDEMRTKSGSSSKKEDKEDIFHSLLSSIDDEEDMHMIMGPSKRKHGMESAGLSDFARHALKEMCKQDWVQEKFLKDPEGVQSSDLLLDNMLSNKQAQQLLQMICYPNGVPNQVDGSEPEVKQIIQRVLQNLDMWGLRVSLLELQLLFKQATTQADTNVLLDNIARGTIDLFHRQTETTNRHLDLDSSQQKPDPDAIWLVGPLISKLPSQVQGRVLKLSGHVLESGNNFQSKGRDKERSQRSKSLLSHQPFLCLILTCLKGQDEQREVLLNSLLSQMERFINNCKEALDKTPDEFKVRANIHEALLLKLSLVGGMFDTIQRNMSNTTDWAQLLLQLVTSGIVETQSNNELFTVLLDMLSVLIHGTLVTEGSDKSEDINKMYINLIKKLRKELGDKQSDSIDKIRQLLPIPKRFFEVMSCEAHGTQMDSKGNKYDGFGKKEGFQVAKKEKISPWEVIEGYKNPPPLSWHLFGAVKQEKKPLKYEDQHRILLFHTHSLRQPLAHFLDPPSLPPEDLEPVPEKHEEKPKEANENQHPDMSKKRKPPKKTKRSNSGSGQGGYNIQPTVRQYPTSANWYPTQTQQHPQFYGNQPMSAGPRFEAPAYGMPGLTPSKMALQQMIRTRHPGNMHQWSGSNQNSMQALQMLQKQHSHRMVRQQIRQSFQNHNRGMTTDGGQGMFSGGMHSMNQSQVGMSQNYAPSYNIPQQSNNMDPSMMAQGNYNQSYNGAQNTGMMPQGGFIPQQQPAQQHFSQQPSRMIVPSQMQTPQNTMGTGSSNYTQMGPTGIPQSTYMQNIPGPTNPQMQQQIRQQRLMAMKRQSMSNPGQQPGPPQQQNAALMAQMQQQMAPNQYGNYPNQQRF
ncbi:mediator of RNA polymerase II transcription subunit 12-like protein isoform X5 [Magallana gigas]|uniref:mediator of RNA polymerase II transcription subunit 12-like protein isoform X5 n=1 Tax=Magallana gigas TaxID=29159 RepID=UPI00148A2DE2|nr:mediator of RNA polymerase II transcription subunit 12-like protein isoform X5 [Crassostrea gigas]